VTAATTLLVDGANVVGSRPTGWWRDRAGAGADLVARLRAATTAGTLAAPVVVVLEGSARAGAPEGEAGGVAVVHAPGSGDDTLVGWTETTPGPVTLVSADRQLRERCRARGASAVGPGWLLARLGPPDPGTGR